MVLFPATAAASRPPPTTDQNQDHQQIHPNPTEVSPIGVNVRVTGYSSRGDRKRMEDTYSVACHQSANNLEYTFFGIFDGHGGKEASQFAKEHLMDTIAKQKLFTSDNDDHVLKAIKDGFFETQQAMLRDVHNWPRTMKGFQSAAGTTASVCFIKRGKIYIGHCGDSGITLGRKRSNSCGWDAVPLTKDHKPNDETELRRIQQSGGKVVRKNGIPRVVWTRPITPDLENPARRSVPTEDIPFLAVARSLGDLWSYNSAEDTFIVSPEPDVSVHRIDISRDRCLVLCTDGALNVMSPADMISHVARIENANERKLLNPENDQLQWVNPSKALVQSALGRWTSRGLSADNTSVVTILLDPPGPSRAESLRRAALARKCHNPDSDETHGRKPIADKQQIAVKSSQVTTVDECKSGVVNQDDSSPLKGMLTSENSEQDTANPTSFSFAVVSRFPNSSDARAKSGESLVLNDGSSSGMQSISHVLMTDSSQKMVAADNRRSTVNKVRQMNRRLDAGLSSPTLPPPLPPRLKTAKVAKISQVSDQNQSTFVNGCPPDLPPRTTLIRSQPHSASVPAFIPILENDENLPVDIPPKLYRKRKSSVPFGDLSGDKKHCPVNNVSRPERLRRRSAILADSTNCYAGRVTRTRSKSVSSACERRAGKMLRQRTASIATTSKGLSSPPSSAVSPLKPSLRVTVRRSTLNQLDSQRDNALQAAKKRRTLF